MTDDRRGPAGTAIAPDAAIDRALRALPPPRAPRTLLPRVMAAVARERARPWYSRAWLAWPRRWQAASIAALAVPGAGAVWLSPYANGGADRLVALAAAASPRLDAVWAGADVVATVVHAIWSAVLGPVAAVGFVAAVLVALGGGACWTTINHLAFDAGKGTSR